MLVEAGEPGIVFTAPESESEPSRAPLEPEPSSLPHPEEAQFLAGPSPRGYEFAMALRTFVSMIRGFRRLYIVGPCVTVFGSARYPEGSRY
jgi:hypothetical protein